MERFGAVQQELGYVLLLMGNSEPPGAVSWAAVVLKRVSIMFSMFLSAAVAMALDGIGQGAQTRFLHTLISSTTDLCMAGSLFPTVLDQYKAMESDCRTTGGSKKTRRGRKCLGGCIPTPIEFAYYMGEA